MVGLVIDAESGVMQTGVQFEEIIDFPVVLHIKIRFQSPDFRIVRHTVEGKTSLLVL